MCGIVAAIANRNVVPVLIDGLKKLEYRGYDSAGIALLGRAVPSTSRAPVGVQRLRSTGRGSAACTSPAPVPFTCKEWNCM